jgi:hypothetical protein
MESIAVGSLLFLVLGGCLPTKSVREAPASREVLTSSKAPEALAGCVSDAWSDEPGVKTNRTAKGWAVIIELDMNTYAIADITSDGKTSTIIYSTAIPASTARRVAAIRPCL